MTESKTHVGELAEPLIVRVASLIVCAIAVACCLAIAGWLPWDRTRYVQIFMDFHLKLDPFTAAVVSVPDTVIWIGGGFAAIALLVVQRVFPSKQTAIVFHLIAIVGCCVIFVLYRDVMREQLFDLIQGMAVGVGGLRR